MLPQGTVLFPLPCRLRRATATHLVPLPTEMPKTTRLRGAVYQVHVYGCYDLPQYNTWALVTEYINGGELFATLANWRGLYAGRSQWRAVSIGRQLQLFSA